MEGVCGVAEGWGLGMEDEDEAIRKKKMKEK